MPAEEPNYLAHAFKSQYNMIGLGTALGFAVLSGTLLPIIVAAGIEMVVLPLVSGSPRFQRLVRGRTSEEPRQAGGAVEEEPDRREHPGGREEAVLDTQVVDLAPTFGSAYLRVSGNTDNVGGREANVRLSRARADAVAQYLMTKGFERNKFDVVGNGPDKPVTSNDTDGGRAKNRRTDFEVIAR